MLVEYVSNRPKPCPEYCKMMIGHFLWITNYTVWRQYICISFRKVSFDCRMARHRSYIAINIYIYIYIYVYIYICVKQLIVCQFYCPCYWSLLGPCYWCLLAQACQPAAVGSHAAEPAALRCRVASPAARPAEVLVDRLVEGDPPATWPIGNTYTYIEHIYIYMDSTRKFDIIELNKWTI